MLIPVSMLEVELSLTYRVVPGVGVDDPYAFETQLALLDLSSGTTGDAVQ